MVEPPALEETHTELRLLEEEYVKAIQPLPVSRAIARTWTICSPESALSSSLCLLPPLWARSTLCLLPAL